MSDEDIHTQTPAVNPPPAAAGAAQSTPWAWLPLIVVVGLALLSGGLVQAYFATRGELVLTRSRAAMRDVENRALLQQIEAERILSSRRVADLIEELRGRSEPGQVQVVPLLPRSNAAVPSLAIVAWNPDRQEGELLMEGIPALTPEQDYQLWITDSEHPVAVSAAVFAASSASNGIRVPFKLDQARANAAGFSVSVERKGGAPSRQGTVVLSSR
jgi:hypothetical protein